LGASATCGPRTGRHCPRARPWVGRALPGGAEHRTRTGFVAKGAVRVQERLLPEVLRCCHVVAERLSDLIVLGRRRCSRTSSPWTEWTRRCAP